MLTTYPLIPVRKPPSTLTPSLGETKTQNSELAHVSLAIHSNAPRPDVLLITVNEHETRALHDEFKAASGADAIILHVDGRNYWNLGTVNGTTVYHALSEMGSSSVGAMQQTVEKAIRALDPGAVISVGVAFGVNEEKQQIGEILLSRQLRPYELQRVGTRIILRDDKPHSSSRLINHFNGFAQTAWQGTKVTLGVILTGDKLIDNLDYRDSLLEYESEAIGGEMEGAGLYVACSDRKVDWMIIKAICDWADGNKATNKDARQNEAAKNAVQFLVQALKNAPLNRPN
jgi:nucleoside phosphorylase